MTHSRTKRRKIGASHRNHPSGQASVAARVKAPKGIRDCTTARTSGRVCWIRWHQVPFLHHDVAEGCLPQVGLCPERVAHAASYCNTAAVLCTVVRFLAEG